MINYFLTEKADRLSVFGQPRVLLKTCVRFLERGFFVIPYASISARRFFIIKALRSGVFFPI